MKIDLHGSEVELLIDKALWIKNTNMILLADLHFGKLSHFRKAGIPVPAKADERNAEQLIHLLTKVKPDRVIFLGDLFHSHYNEEWEVIGQIINHFNSISFELVLGNHDILGVYQYEKHKIILHQHALMLEDFILTHEPLQNVEAGKYNLCGHIHPGVNLRGTGKQSITLPCFYFGKNQGILPAFGAFTGLFRIQPKKDERIYVIAENKIIAYAQN